MLAEEGAGICAYRASVGYLICVTFSLPPGVGGLPPAVGGWLRLLLVALPGLFCLSFCDSSSGSSCH